LAKHWKAPWFTKKAVVVAGPAPSAFTKKVKESMIAAEEARLKRQVDGEKRVWEAEQKTKREVRQRSIDQQRRAAEAAGEPFEEPAEPEAETPDWEAKMKVEHSSVVKDVKEFRVPAPKDIEPLDIPKIFGDFSFPAAGPREVVDPRWLLDSEPSSPKKGAGEGFDAVEFAWEKKPGADKYLAAYKAKLKVEEIYDSFTPTSFCSGAVAEFLKEKTAMREHQDTYMKEVAKRKAAKEKAAAGEEKKEDGEAKEGDDAKPKDESGDVDMEKKEEEEPAVDLSVDDDAPPVEITSKLEIESIDGKKTPLYKAWGMEDWILLTLRVELHIMLRAFKADVTDKDPERKGITTKTLPYYYEKFLGKAWDPYAFGQPTLEKILEYASDAVGVSSGLLTLKSKEALPLEAFVKTTEKSRRDRESKLLMGDDSARLEFNAPGKGKGKKGADKGKGAQNKGYAAKGYPQPPKGGKGFNPQIGQQSYPPQSYAPSYGQKRPAPDDYAAKRPAMMSGGYGYGGGYGKGYAYGKGK
jgi:hypothetical protein